MRLPTTRVRGGDQEGMDASWSPRDSRHAASELEAWPPGWNEFCAARARFLAVVGRRDENELSDLHEGDGPT